MKTSIALTFSILAVFTAFLIIKQPKTENFTADGLILNVPPEWFRKKAYDINDWIVAYYPEQISNVGGCDMHYRGDNRELNYLSSAYRFFRM